MDKRSFCHHVATSSFGGVAELAKRNITQNTHGSLSLNDDVSSAWLQYSNLKQKKKRTKIKRKEL